MFCEEPGTLLVEEVLVEQGTDRAEIHDVAGERVVNRVSGEDVDLGVVASPHDLEFTGVGDLPGEPNATGAHDAPILVQLDEV